MGNTVRPGHNEAKASPERRYPVEALHKRLSNLLTERGESRNPQMPDGLYYEFQHDGTNWLLTNYMDASNRHNDVPGAPEQTRFAPPFRELLQKDQSILVVEPAPDQPVHDHYVLVDPEQVVPGSRLDTSIVQPALNDHAKLTKGQPVPGGMLVIHVNTGLPHPFFELIDRPSDIPVLIEPANPGAA